MKVDCRAGPAAGVEVVPSRGETKDRAFARNKVSKIEFLKEPAGSAADLVVRHVCSNQVFSVAAGLPAAAPRRG